MMLQSFSGPRGLVGFTREPSWVQRLCPFTHRDWYVVLQTDPGCWPGKSDQAGCLLPCLRPGAAGRGVEWTQTVMQIIYTKPVPGGELMNSRVRDWPWWGWPRHTSRWGVNLKSPCPPAPKCGMPNTKMWIIFARPLPLDQSGMGDPTSSLEKLSPA